jgi:hypothetical protein
LFLNNCTQTMRSNYDYSLKLKGCFICHAILLSLPGKIKMISIFVLQICQSWSLCNVLVHSMGSMIGWLQSYCTHDWNYITLHTQYCYINSSSTTVNWSACRTQSVGCCTIAVRPAMWCIFPTRFLCSKRAVIKNMFGSNDTNS